MREALYYDKLENKAVKCLLCPNCCIIQSGKSGSCRSRMNIEGALYAINYGKTVSCNLDPIEKKPLYHYHPGSMILSIGANSCNLHCEYCQNYEISQTECSTNRIMPEELLTIMLKKNLKQIAFTYTEPFTWYEYILDCGKLFQPHDIKIVLVTNGYINQQPLLELLPYIDAMNIDLKSFNDTFYQDICKGRLLPVLDTIRTANDYCHIELTNLLIPNLNDREEELIKLVDFIAEINREIPLHFSRYYPRWKCKESETPMQTLLLAYKIAQQKLNYVYIGNIPNGDYSNTNCPDCLNLLIDRSSYHAKIVNISENKCRRCGKDIYGRF